MEWWERERFSWEHKTKSWKGREKRKGGQKEEVREEEERERGKWKEKAREGQCEVDFALCGIIWNYLSFKLWEEIFKEKNK